MEEEKEELVELDEVDELVDQKAKAAKIIAIICFSLVMAALAAALISDIIIVGQQILMFVFACLASVIVFLIAVILMVISCIFIFGIYILESEGFWPLIWTQNVFNDIMNDAKMTTEQIQAVFIVRGVLFLICLVVLVLAIIALTMSKQAKGEDTKRKQGLTRAFGIVSTVLSVLGLFATLAVMVLFALLF